VNYQTGFSFSYFLGEGRPLTDLLENQLGVPVTIENDSRAMTYAEYLAGDCGNIKNMLFINASWGLGMGMILDGKLYFGKSGYSGEFGHFPMLNNNQICRCGKIGCLETGASGSALHRIFIEKMQEGKNSSLKEKYEKEGEISLSDILKAVQEEDVLAIEAIEEVGFVLGRAIAGLIKIFNPEMVVIGGKLPMAEDSLMLPVKSEINKYSFNIISKDTTIRFSKLGQMAGPLGACLLSRSKMLGLI
jgi:predicted NBD/HSP70 family sugar kinase